jgi:hypothetical protein
VRTGVLRSLVMAFVVALSASSCGGSGSSSTIPPRSPASPAVIADQASTAVKAIQALSPADPTNSGTVSGSPGVGCINPIFAFVCTGPPGSSATLTFEVDLGPLPLPPVKCGGVSWSERTISRYAPASTQRAPHAARALHSLGGGYSCGTASYALTVSAPAVPWSYDYKGASGTYLVCFDLPINPCGTFSTPEGRLGVIAVPTASPAPTPAPPTPQPTSSPGPGGSGGGSCSASAAKPAQSRAKRTGVIGGDGSPPPATPTPAPACSIPPSISIDDKSPTNGTDTKIVGQHVLLNAVPSPAGASMTDIAWSIPGNTVADYQPTLNSAVPVPLTALSSSSASFYWIEGTQSVTVTLSAKINGTAVSATKQFAVLAPTGVTMPTTTRNVLVSYDQYPQLPNQWALSLGLPIEGRQGIDFTRFGFTAPANGAGAAAVRQLIYSQYSTVDAAGTRNTVQSTSGQFWLDSTLLYNNQQVAVGAGSAVTLADQRSFSDAPALALSAPYVSESKNDAFQTYLIYRPNGADSIWVTVGKLSWSWSGTATVRRNAWSLTASSAPFPVNPNGNTSIHELPAWNGVLASAGDRGAAANARHPSSVVRADAIRFATIQVVP